MKIWLSGVLACAVGIIASGVADGQDSVVVRSGDEDRLITRTGLIMDWLGGELRMEIQGRVTTIENEKVVSFETDWDPAYREALALIDSGRHADALPLLQQAIAGESRLWARRVMLDQLVRVLLLVGQPRGAGETFLMLMIEDPDTRFFGSIPLAWEEGMTDGATAAAAGEWMGSSSLIQQLMGASWLINSPQRAQAVKKLEELSRDIDSRIAHLASAQLWRDQVLTVDSATVTRWERQLKRMPTTIQCGPRLVLGEAQRRIGQANDALLCWMWVAIMNEQHYRQAGFALRQSALLLQNEGQATEAQRLWGELSRKFQQSPWTAEALSQLNRQ